LNHIRINRIIRTNLHVHTNDILSIERLENIPTGERINALPFADTGEELPENLLGNYLIPYFTGANRLHSKKKRSTPEPSKKVS
jgi:hypothetical protein